MTGTGNNIKEEKVHFYTLNVGQGDSHIIHFPTREAAIVIDPGNGELINELLHNHLEIKYLPLILISHFDLDHMRGLNSVIRGCLERPGKPEIKPGYVFFSDQGFGKSIDCQTIKNILQEFKQLSKQFKLQFEYCIADNSSSGVFIEVLNKLGIEGKIIYPTRLLQGEAIEKKDYNLASVLLYLVFAGQKILYTGDLPYAGWEKIAKEEDLTSDVFKVPHHGGNISRNPGSHTQKILERVNPKFALISVGSDNSYQHPYPEVVEAIVTHNTHPHLFCTQMAGHCGAGENIQQKIDDFYEKIMDEGDYEITQKMRPANGIPCAGTIRITFDGKTGFVSSAPSPLVHLSMLKTLFKPAQLLCGARFPG